MAVREVVVLSGKGGTGKTTLTASLIPWLDSAVLADCDVDAPDLDILLKPEIRESRIFKGAWKAVNDLARCSGCGTCLSHCRFGAISRDFKINPLHCEGCGVCAYICPENTVRLEETAVGEIFHSRTPYGKMIHGKLYPGEETSGKLVSQVRKRAVETAEREGLSLVLIDGSPGIGCNVISSLTGASLVILVAEPSVSSMEDLKRLYTLIQRFSLPSVAVINKWDLSMERTTVLEAWCVKKGIPLVMKIPFSKEMIQAQSRREIPSIALEREFREWGLKNLLNTIQS